jgi:hypothetical protein
VLVVVLGAVVADALARGQEALADVVLDGGGCDAGGVGELGDAHAARLAH